MLQLSIDYKLDEWLELGLWLLENQFEICFRETLAFFKAILFEEFKNVLSRDVTFRRTIDPLEEHNWTELAHEPPFLIETHVQEICLGFHEFLLALDHSDQELAEKKVDVALLVLVAGQVVICRLLDGLLRLETVFEDCCLMWVHALTHTHRLVVPILIVIKPTLRVDRLKERRRHVRFENLMCEGFLTRGEQ